MLCRTVNLTEYTVLPQSEPDINPCVVGKIRMLACCRILRFMIWTCVERVVAILVQTVRAECVLRVLQNIPFEVQSLEFNLCQLYLGSIYKDARLFSKV